MATEKAKKVGEKEIRFPPERKKKQSPFAGMKETFDLGILSLQGDLLSAFYAMRATYNQLKAEDTKQRLAELENETDEFVIEVQSAKKRVEQLKAENFEAEKRYTRASDVLHSANNDLEQFRSEIEDSEDEVLLTSKQEKERKAKLQTYSERVGEARLRETNALTELRHAIAKFNEAKLAAAAWEYAALQLKGELKSLKQAA